MSQKIKCLLSVALFATYPTLAKFVLERNSPAIVTLLTELVSVAVLLFVFGVFPEYKKYLAVWRHERLGSLLAMGFLAGAAGPLLMLMGLSHSTVLNGALTLSLQTPFVMVLSYLYLKEKFHPVHGVSFSLILLGLLVYTTMAFQFMPRFVWSDLFFVGSAAAFAGANVIYKRRLTYIPHELVLITRNLLGGLFIFFGLIVFSFGSDVLISFDSTSLAGVALIVLMPIILAQSLWYSSLARMQSIEAGFFDALYPIFAALFALALLRESAGWTDIVGGLIVVAGLVVSEWPRRQERFARHRAVQSFKQH